jgi:hypothetical protein
MSDPKAARPWTAASAPWATWGSGMLCAATSDGENAGVLGHLDSGKVAERACADHNAMLDLGWLAEAGFNVELSRRQHGRWRVSLQPAPDGWTAMCGQGPSIGGALAKARTWAEGRTS